MLGNATAFWSVVWSLHILNGRKCRNKLFEFWWELTYLWHRVKPNLTVRSVPKVDDHCNTDVKERNCLKVMNA